MWTLLLLAATVRSFAHMPLGISDRNNSYTSFHKCQVKTMVWFPTFPYLRTPDCCVQRNRMDTCSSGFSFGGPEASLKKGSLMTSSYSANRDNHFWSSLRYGHSRIRSWDCDITDVAEGENAKGCSWCTTLKTLKVGKTRLATHKG